MELVGMAVRKCFIGLESISGVVKSFDASTGNFKIYYDNGAHEEAGLDKIASMYRKMGHESTPAVFPHRRGRGRPPKKLPRLDPDERHMVCGVFAEPTSNGFCTGRGELGGISQTDDLGSNASHFADDGMGRSLIDHSMDVESLRGSDVGDAVMDEVLPDCRSPGEKHDEDLGGEVVSVNLETKDEESTRQRKKLSGQSKFTPDMPLRRSSRRASTAPVSPPDALVCKNEPFIQNSGEQGEKLEFGMGASKPALPPSSSDLDVDGLPVLDLFSVYSCLRSFSRSLFLSPFSLETLVAALRSKYANPLINSIHFSLLHALKPHLKLLMDEEFQPATDCLRNLNWDFLDLLTWPFFLVEYLLFCGSAMRFDFKHARLKLLDVEYYEQPAKVKLEILRCLCDDVIEVEFLRSEFNRKVTDSELIDPNNSMNSSRKRKHSAMQDGESSMLQQEIDDIADGNSDECCLCRMDGNLLCCDGCPAAFHSRCVGVVKDLLPEGEWYCPECLVDKGSVVSFLMPFKGADFLGRDSHGRLFYGCCGYLLVSDSCDSNNALCHYYNKNDLVNVINILKSEPSPFDDIRNAISSYWGIPLDDTCSNERYESDIHSLRDILDEKVQVKLRPVLKKKYGCDNYSGASSPIPFIACSTNCDGTDSIQPSALNSIELEEKPSLPAVPESVNNKLDVISFSHTSEINGPTGIASVKPTDQTIPKDESYEFPGWTYPSVKRVVASQVQSDPFSYVNYYCFGQVAASMAEELLPKHSEINFNDSLKSEEVMKSDQLKAICKELAHWCWYRYYNLMVDIQKEDCGWCFACRRLNDAECLFKVVDEKHLEGIKSNLEVSTRHTGMNSEKNKKSHIIFAMHHILSIENRVRSLLSGPWENLYYSEQWRRAVLDAYDVASLKLLILSLEFNLRRVALLAEWLKPVDTDQNGGFASFNLKGFHWWRGGKLSRKLFYWKMLPRSLASKCSRQAGRKKISNLFYNEGSEFSKRSKGISWRVAVEMSVNVAQLIYQVKDLDSNIKWSEISSSHIYPQCTKESKKIEKLFKKVLVRKKCIEGTEIKYLLDFGRRETIPANVTKYGVLLEECSDKRKRFWLGETYVPLNLVRAFEEKKLSRLSKKKDSGQACEKRSIVTMKKSKKLKGFTYLFSRVRDSEKHCCGHCSKDVLVREAVNCWDCNGFFHKKHFRVPKGVTATAYTCFKCHEKEISIAEPKTHKIAGRKRKDSISRKGNPISMSKKNKKNLDSLGEKLKKNTVFSGKKSKVDQFSMSKGFSSAKKSEKNKLFSAKKSNEKMVSLVSKPKKNLVAVQCRKNPVRLARKLKQSSISLAKKSKLIQTKRKQVMKRKRKIAPRKGQNAQSKNGKALRSDNFISWFKKKRSVLRHSYWLNGLLWLNDHSNERGIHFRDKKVFLPLQSSQDVSVKPICSLCCKDYNSGLIFVCCEGCGDWFHGEAFGLELKSISNLAGFKCPKCRMKNVPVCPFSTDPTHCIIKINNGCNAYVDPVEVQLKKCNGEPESAACEDCTAFAPCKDHSQGKRESVFSHIKDAIVLSGEIISDWSSAVHPPRNEETIPFSNNENILNIRLKSSSIEEGIEMTSRSPEKLLS